MGFDKDDFVMWASRNLTGAQSHIVLFLVNNEKTKTMIAKELDMPRPTIDKAFTGLIQKGLVEQTKATGREKFFTAVIPDEIRKSGG